MNDHRAAYKIMQAAQKLADETGQEWYVVANDDGKCLIANQMPEDLDLFVVVMFPR